MEWKRGRRVDGKRGGGEEGKQVGREVGEGGMTERHFRMGITGGGFKPL